MLHHFVSCSPGVRHASGIIFAPGTCTGDLQSICIFSVDCISSEFRLRDGDRVTGGWRCTCKVAFSAGQRPNMLLLSFSNIIGFIMRMMITIARIFNNSDYCNQMIVKGTSQQLTLTHIFLQGHCSHFARHLCGFACDNSRLISTMQQL